MSKVAAFISRGQGGIAVNTLLSGDGTGRLASRVKSLGVETHVFNWDQGALIAKTIRAMPASTKIVIGGTSLGGNEAPQIGKLLGSRSVDFMFGIQPSKLSPRNAPIPPNVKRAMFFYSPWWWPVAASYQWERAADNHVTTLIAYRTFLPHPGDNAESVHGPILDEIKKLLG